MITAMTVVAAALTFLFHIADFAARGYFAVASDDAAAGKSCEAEKTNETHTALFANLGPNPRIEMSPVRATLVELLSKFRTADEFEFGLRLRRFIRRSARWCRFAGVMQRLVPTFGFDLRTLGDLEAREIVRSPCWIELEPLSAR